MITLAWHCNSLNGTPYPVLWYGDIPSEATAAGKYLIKQSHAITGADETAVWEQPEGTRTDFCAKKYPYNDPGPIDEGAKVVIVSQATTTAAASTEV